jgi:hypothetical protein
LIQNKKEKADMLYLRGKCLDFEPEYTKQAEEFLSKSIKLMPTKTVQSLINQIKTDNIGSWDEVHEFYQTASSKYPQQKIAHALAALEFITGKKLESFKTTTLVDLLDKYLAIKTSITDSILYTRSKDYKNPFRKMVYENEEEMNKVIGSIDNNSFILEQQAMLNNLSATISELKKQLKAK